MTSIKYDHLQVMGTITGKFQVMGTIVFIKFHKNPLKTVDKIVSMDGRTDRRTHYYSLLQLMLGAKKSFSDLPTHFFFKGDLKQSFLLFFFFFFLA